MLGHIASSKGLMVKLKLKTYVRLTTSTLKRANLLANHVLQAFLANKLD